MSCQVASNICYIKLSNQRSAPDLLGWIWYNDRDSPESGGHGKLMIQEWNPYALHSEQGQRLSSSVELVYTMLLFVKRCKIVVSYFTNPHRDTPTQFHIYLSSGGMVLIYYTTQRKKTRKKKNRKRTERGDSVWRKWSSCDSFLVPIESTRPGFYRNWFDFEGCSHFRAFAFSLLG